MIYTLAVIEKINKFIGILFSLLLFLVPLIIIPINSELFEFGKLVFVYIITVLIISAWAIKCILSKKLIFRKSFLTVPIILFVASQIISTYVSIDPATSLFGYYSRFNGGLLSTLAYSLLYFAFISNVSKKDALKALFFLLASSLLVSLYGILEHFGIDKNIWVQDVQNRVFSTLGQPNWLAAYLVALVPISLAFFLTKSKYWLLLGAFQYLTLLYTKSRSGIIAFLIAYSIFWLFSFLKHKKKFIITLLVFGLVTLSVGTPWTPDLESFFTARKINTNRVAPKAFVPALESGGTESGDIRKIVWQGAVDVWKTYPVFGSGVETFAYSFYQFRPKEHNLTSEWDFLYNKAHNEYLNYLSTTGLFGLATYLAVIFVSIYQLRRHPALLSGYLSILITNFFGFSVVTVSLLFFLFPAIAFCLYENK